MNHYLEQCFPCVLTKEVLEECNPFTCENDSDMDEFFRKDALDYTKFRMGKSYCFRLIENPKEIVACFTVSNDSIRLKVYKRSSFLLISLYPLHFLFPSFNYYKYNYYLCNKIIMLIYYRT